MTQTILADNLTTVGEQRPPMRTDVFYALTTLGSTTIWSVLNGWLLYFYVPPGGTPRVPAALYGVLVLVVHSVNIVLDPPIGYLSDHTHSRWGRRLPVRHQGVQCLDHAGSTRWCFSIMAAWLKIDVKRRPFRTLSGLFKGKDFCMRFPCFGMVAFPHNLVPLD